VLVVKMVLFKFGLRKVPTCDQGSLCFRIQCESISLAIREAHAPGEITCLTFHEDNYTLLSRATDDTMKVILCFLHFSFKRYGIFESVNSLSLYFQICKFW
jgi:hypothetical protein